jgi:hypothetical protein
MFDRMSEYKRIALVSPNSIKLTPNYRCWRSLYTSCHSNILEEDEAMELTEA